jgi:hypothetical protein
MAVLSYAVDETAAPGFQTVKGDLLKIEDEFYRCMIPSAMKSGFM